MGLGVVVVVVVGVVVVVVVVVAESVKKAILQSQIGAWEPKSRSLIADSRAVETAIRLSWLGLNFPGSCS